MPLRTKCAMAISAMALGACTEPPREIETWMGDGVQGHDGDGNHRRDSRLNAPMEVLLAADGSAYITDWNNHAIRFVGTDGRVETLVGSRAHELPGDWPCERPDYPDACDVPLDQVASASQVKMNHPMDVALLPDGGVLVAAWHNHKIVQCTPSSEEVRILSGLVAPGFSGDDGPASAAHLNFPSSIVVDASGAVLVSDQRNNRVRRIDLAGGGLITTVVGKTTLSALSGDGGPATDAELALTAYDRAGGSDNPPPGGALALGDDGRLFIADTFNHCIRAVSPGDDGLVTGAVDETIDVVAGRCGQAGFSGDGGPAREALFDRPFDVEIGPDGRLYVVDTYNHALRAIDLGSGVVDRVAGTGRAGFSGDGGPALEAQLRTPYGVAFDAEGFTYIVDTGNNRIRRIVP
jgi:DNA-binding beta-propeller fold protein YncE